ncbi:MAG: bacteriohemerythrin [Magnetococcales bacterium]|nr:bacteriohemerythrin [Magnetococcales bacterium]
MNDSMITDLKILAVDDTPDNLDVVRGVLGDDYKLLMAVNGALALKIANKQKPDLILLDVMMPEMDGHEVCRRLREDEATRDIPIIFLTALTSSEDEGAGLKLGAVDYIAKPINPHILKARVKTHLSLKRANDFLTKQRDELESEVVERKKSQAEVASSFRYASRIQRSILPLSHKLDKVIPDRFIIWEPRDVVGGDMFWLRSWGNGSLIILGDCTGHGVPGAFMTMISNGALDMACLEVSPGDPATLLQRIHHLIQSSLGQDYDDSSEGSDDGIEMGICFLHNDSNTLTFSGARFELFILNDNEVTTIKGVKAGLGYRHTPADTKFINHEVKFGNDTIFYMTTDGLIDQVGGEKRRGFGKKRFQSLITSHQNTPLAQQKDVIYQALLEHQGNESRRDDVSVLGFRPHNDKNQYLYEEIQTDKQVESDYFVLDDSLLVGFAPIDDDHQKLVDLINSLHTAVKNGNDIKIISNNLNQLVEYTAWHFRHEERLMHSKKYPDSINHKKEHTDLIEQIHTIQLKFKNEDENAALELNALIKRWLINHILEVDNRLARFLERA